MAIMCTKTKRWRIMYLDLLMVVLPGPGDSGSTGPGRPDSDDDDSCQPEWPAWVTTVPVGHWQWPSVTVAVQGGRDRAGSEAPSCKGAGRRVGNSTAKGTGGRLACAARLRVAVGGSNLKRLTWSCLAGQITANILGVRAYTSQPAGGRAANFAALTSCGM